MHTSKANPDVINIVFSKVTQSSPNKGVHSRAAFVNKQFFSSSEDSQDAHHLHGVCIKQSGTVLEQENSQVHVAQSGVSSTPLDGEHVGAALLAVLVGLGPGAPAQVGHVDALAVHELPAGHARA